MAESTLSLGFAEFMNMASFFLGYGADYTKLGTNEQNVCDLRVQDGYRQFLYPPPIDGANPRYTWRFLKPTATIDLPATYSTGTITVASGVVTLADGTFPSWAADGELVVGGTSYTVDTRDSDSQITLDDTSATAAAGSTYALSQVNYDLPDNYGAISGPLTFTPQSGYPPIEITGEGRIRALRQITTASGRPALAAVIPVNATTATEGQRFKLMVYPAPSSAYTLTYKYSVLVDKLTAALPYPLGGMAHGNTIAESVLDCCDSFMNDLPNGPHQARFMRMLATSIATDQGANVAEVLGRSAEDPLRGMALTGDGLLLEPVTYNDVPM